ncbi:MAG: Uma2 family endonuclease [Nostoc sp. NOS(2021)]|uniref:Uma2 family endonuclease n=1 Tax=Nostoc sp. NOS(2021) TaxID=2815407 RepID=UPI0025E5970B|nr:Uma2 family endonuclease [Nostoc sp. NOS(2021)]MBN3896807.1 Uma2 family endonuclease [Nostoc sp. NOS(2021)]
MNTVVLNLEPIAHLTDEQFYQLCIANSDLSLEMNGAGELIIVPPVGGESGNQEADLITDLNNWNRQVKLGKVFSSSTIFILPNGAKRSPDAAWVKLERWEALTLEERKKFPPLVPDFAIELRSETDVWRQAATRLRLAPIQAKMREYIENGLRLGWLINPQDNQVEVYRLLKAVEVIQMPAILSGEDILPGFELQV